MLSSSAASPRKLIGSTSLKSACSVTIELDSALSGAMSSASGTLLASSGSPRASNSLSASAASA
jgi:hypothetical protein